MARMMVKMEAALNSSISARIQSNRIYLSVIVSLDENT